MWQSMYIPGTPLATHDRTGAPGIIGGRISRLVKEMTIDIPIVMFGTKWLGHMVSAATL
jgi:hypothetical protein